MLSLCCNKAPDLQLTDNEARAPPLPEPRRTSSHALRQNLQPRLGPRHVQVPEVQPRGHWLPSRPCAHPVCATLHAWNALHPSLFCVGNSCPAFRKRIQRPLLGGACHSWIEARYQLSCRQYSFFTAPAQDGLPFGQCMWMPCCQFLT